MELFLPQYLLLLFLTLAASLITLFTGFGVGTVLMPALALFFDVKIAVFLAAIVHLCNNLARLWLYHASIEWRIIRRFGVISLGGALLGSFAQFYLASSWLKHGVGMFLLVYAVWQLLPQKPSLQLPDKLDIIGGFLSGLLGGLIGNQGAIRSLYLLHYGLEKKSLIASGALIAVIIDLTRIPVYAYDHRQYLVENAVLLTLIVAASICGTLLGSKLLPKLSAALFQKIILFAVALLGAAMLFGVL